MRNKLGLKPYFCEEQLPKHVYEDIERAKRSKAFSTHCAEWIVYRRESPMPMIYVARILAIVEPDASVGGHKFDE